MNNYKRINRGREMKVSEYFLILLFVFSMIITGCSKSEDNSKQEQKTAVQKDYWTCPMHPQIKTDRPGVCPICEMDLIKKTEGSEEKPDTTKNMAGMVTLSNKKQVLANVTTFIVKKENIKDQITAYSYLDFVENNRKTISARFNGRIEKLFIDKTGDYIRKGQPLFEIYSPDLVQVQNEYLSALKSSTNSPSLLLATKRKLEIFGLTSNQIQTLEKTGEPSITLTFFSPISGTVIEKKVQEGVYINEGTVIYDVAELSTLWNISEVNENNLSNIKIGGSVKLHLRAYPGEEFSGKVTFIYPVVNAQTRTVKIRSEFSNHAGKLKPQMYGETIFSNAAGVGLLVPADAVVIAGKRAVIWAKTSDGMFEARNVQIGNRFGDKYQILSGIKEGDEIAATGGFLIDSESQLKTETPSGHNPDETTKPAGKKKSSSNDMPGMKM
jgi:membrane fusion protein, copper/silver efflux system